MFVNQMLQPADHACSPGANMGFDHGFYIRWLLISLRALGVNQGFRFVEGIWLHRKSSQIRFFSRKLPIFYRTYA